MKKLNTYSIAAYDPTTNQLGVAVQSHWFAVGALCPWIEPGVGVIATQSLVEVSYGPRGLELLTSGRKAPEALNILLTADENPDVRQVAVVDASGNVSAHTGDKCIAHAGHIIGEGFSVQANMMLKPTVWKAMASAYRNSTGPLSQRLLAAMDAAQEEGGDIRGMQSACMLVVNNIQDKQPWKHQITNLRIDDHPQPIQELRRLLSIEEAYALMNEGDALLSKHQIEEAQKKYMRAAQLASHIDEIPFWQAVTMVESGYLDEALPLFKEIFVNNRNWAELVKRLPASGLLTVDEKTLAKILSVMD